MYVVILKSLQTSVWRQRHTYPFPTTEDIFARLAGGRVFAKLYLSQAYLQLSVDDDSKDLLVINTPKGLFRYN